MSDESIRMLADLLKLPPHDDTTVLLQAIAATLNTKFNPIAVSAALAARDEVSATPLPCPAGTFDLRLLFWSPTPVTARHASRESGSCFLMPSNRTG